METALALPINQESPQAMMMAAIDKGMDLDKLERFMILQERYEANQARKAYSQAMSDFKANPPEIEKDKKVSYKTTSGTTAYNHASLGNVTDKIGAALSKHGLSAAWTTRQDEKGVTVTCRISHIFGHSEETSLTAALDQSGGKNTIQALGSTISYLERYTILALTGLATHDQDDDGKSAEEVAYISDKQKSTIIDMIQAKEADEKKFCEYMKVKEIGQIKASDFDKAMAALRAKKGKA
ncbi:MAG: ERF family protein [Candidatus Omnitrophica bacterium]|jgi:hypothetical protein|nr:ERF family protein [Candidatus Omnitrophota bacterium]